MFVYLFVLVSSLLLCYMDRWKPRLLVVDGTCQRCESRRPTVWFLLACGIILFFAVLRADTVGGDLVSYKKGFEGFKSSWEPAYVFLQNSISRLTGNFNIFMAVCAILTLVPMLYVVYKETRSYLPLAMLVFLTEAYASSFTGLRFSLSYACLYLAFHFKRRARRGLWHWAFLILAFAFHYSSIILILVFIFLDYKFSLFGYLTAGIITLFLTVGKSVGEYLIYAIAPNYSHYLQLQDNSYVPALNLFLFGMLIVLCYIYKDKLITVDKKNILLINIFVAAFCFQIGCWWLPFGIRISQMFRYFCFLIIPRVIACEENRNARLFLIVSFAFFYFLLFIFFITGANNVVPYRFFWQ